MRLGKSSVLIKFARLAPQHVIIYSLAQQWVVSTCRFAISVGEQNQSTIKMIVQICKFLVQRWVSRHAPRSDIVTACRELGPGKTRTRCGGNIMSCDVASPWKNAATLLRAARTQQMFPRFARALENVSTKVCFQKYAYSALPKVWSLCAKKRNTGTSTLLCIACSPAPFTLWCGLPHTAGHQRSGNTEIRRSMMGSLPRRRFQSLHSISSETTTKRPETPIWWDNLVFYPHDQTRFVLE